MAKPSWVERSVWEDAETASLEELEAAADLYDRLVAAAGSEGRNDDVHGKSDEARAVREVPPED